MAYDSTILFSKGIFIGSNEVPRLQDLWVKGFGNYSESINAFLWTSDSNFDGYVQMQAATNFHNSLFANIQEYCNYLLDHVDIFQAILMLSALAAVVHYLVDFILSLRYIFKIEQKVGKLLL